MEQQTQQSSNLPLEDLIQQFQLADKPAAGEGGEDPNLEEKPKVEDLKIEEKPKIEEQEVEVGESQMSHKKIKMSSNASFLMTNI